MAVVNWKLISDAISYWEGAFRYREVPWIIPEQYNLITHPNTDHLVTSKLGSHVGSAEQSFVYLDHTGQLPKGKWMTCTPCFRIEPVLDDLHQSGFMKVELYQTDAVCQRSFDILVQKTLRWFKRTLEDFSINPMHCYKAPTSEGYDIMVGDVEVGSYGIRSYEHLTWIYATAMAEPRFSTAMEQVEYKEPVC